MLKLSAPFILASASTRRKELFSKITDEYEVIPSDVSEKVPKGISALKTAEYLARMKANDIARKNPNKVVIGCDTVVINGRKIMGKPYDREHAVEMLSALSGKTHLVITGVCIKYGDKTVSFSEKTRVTFRRITTEEIEDYISSFEPFDKAGSYAVQGQGSLFVKRICGDYYNVVGLPVCKLYGELKKMLG